MIRFTFTYYWWKKSAPVSFSIGEQGPLTFTFYWWNMAHTIIFTFTKIWSASLSLSMSEIWSRQLLLFSPEVKYDLQHCIVQGFHSPLSQLRCKSFLTVYCCTGTEFSLWRLCVYIPVLTVVIDDSLGRVGHESQNLQMLFSEQVMVRKDHINLVIFNLVSPPIWKEELSHNKLMHKVQMYMSCFCSVLLTHICLHSFAMQGDTPIDTNFSCWSVLVKYIFTKGSMVITLIALGRQTNKGQTWSSCL